MMRALPDTSFVWALYGHRTQSALARVTLARLDEPLPISGLLRFEFEQAIRFEVYRHRHDRSAGLSEGFATAMLVYFENDLSNGLLQLVPFEWAAVCQRAQLLSERHTAAFGSRAFDILHVATALHLGAREFLTFDKIQTRLAKAEGLAVLL